MPEYNYTIQAVTVCLRGQREALIRLKQLNDGLEGEAAAIRGNLLNLIIDNLSELVIKPLEEARYR